MEERALQISPQAGGRRDVGGFCVFRLPVSGQEVALKQPTGGEEMGLLESSGDQTQVALALAERLASPLLEPAGMKHEGPGIADWSSLSVTDFDAMILRLR